MKLSIVHFEKLTELERTFLEIMNALVSSYAANILKRKQFLASTPFDFIRDLAANSDNVIIVAIKLATERKPTRLLVSHKTTMGRKGYVIKSVNSSITIHPAPSSPEIMRKITTAA